MSEIKETAECRGCKMKLRGEPYYKGGRAFHPVTGEETKKFMVNGSCVTENDLNI